MTAAPDDRVAYPSDQRVPARPTGVFIGDYQDVRGGPWLLPDTWVHLAGTYDGTTQRLYVNGTEVANRPQSRPIKVSGGVLRIEGNSILGEIFKGRIDEIRVYNRALSAAEILTDMNTSVATSSPPVSELHPKQKPWKPSSLPVLEPDPNRCAHCGQGRLHPIRALPLLPRATGVSGHAKITQYGKRNFTHLCF